VALNRSNGCSNGYSVRSVLASQRARLTKRMRPLGSTSEESNAVVIREIKSEALYRLRLCSSSAQRRRYVV